MRDVKRSLNNLLEVVGYEIGMENSCYLLWGETEMPDCLKEKIQMELNEENN